MIHIMRYLQNLPAFNLLGNAQTAAKVLCEYSTRKTVVGVISDLDSFLIARDLYDRDGWSKRFGVEKLHVLVHAINDDGTHACSGGFVRLWVFFIAFVVTMYDFGAILDCICDKAFVLFYTRRSYENRRGLVAAEDTLHGALESFDELWLDVLVYQNAF